MEPAVKRALDLYGKSGKRILAAATQVTVTGEKLHRLIEEVDYSHLTDLLALPRLVRFAEAGLFDNKEVEEYLRLMLKPYDMSLYSSFVLGCTHFNFFKKTLRRLLPETVHLVDGNDGTVKELCRRLSIKPSDSRLMPFREPEFYLSGLRAEAAERKKLLTFMNWLAEMEKLS